MGTAILTRSDVNDTTTRTDKPTVTRKRQRLDPWRLLAQIPEEARQPLIMHLRMVARHGNRPNTIIDVLSSRLQYSLSAGEVAPEYVVQIESLRSAIAQDRKAAIALARVCRRTAGKP
jgi:hypothetical protein